MSRRNSSTRLIALAILTLLVIGASLLLEQTRFFQILEMKTVDYRFRLIGEQGTASRDIVLVEIDDNSIKHLEPAFGRWPWPREVHGYFLRFMQAAEARLVTFDVLFMEQDLDNRESDLFFARETERAGNVVHSVFLGNQDNVQVSGEVDPKLLTEHSIPGSHGFMEFIQADFPIPRLAESAAAIGHVANVLDPDGPFRNYLLMASHQGRSLPSLSLATALLARNLRLEDLSVEDDRFFMGKTEIPLNADRRLPIWFNGGPGTYRSHSYGHVVYSQFQIEEGATPGLDPSEFRDKIVLVGVSGTGLHDVFTTPYAGGAGEAVESDSGTRLGKMAGVEVHANVLDNLLNERFLREAPQHWTWMIGLSFAAATLSLLFFLPLQPAVIGCIVLLGSYLLLVQQVFEKHYRLPVASAAVCWGLAVALGLAYQYWFEGAEKRKVKGIFSRYVSKDVYTELMSDPESVRLGGKRTVVTVLFSDLRGFTSLSEKRRPEEIVAQLNEYFSAMVDIVFRSQGTIDKFVGDMIMALFSAPMPDPHHADHAVQCAIDMQKRLAELNRDWESRGLPALASGVGINSGEMIAGNVGAETIRSYTVIGDNVNLGARLESLCKEYQAGIIISEYTRAMLREEYSLRELGEVTVKGKSKPVRIFEVLF